MTRAARLAWVLTCACGSDDEGAGFAALPDLGRTSDIGASDTVAGPGCEVGAGTEAFLPLANGDEISIIAGPQGGYHIFTSVRWQRLDAEPARVRISARVAETDEYLGPGNESSPPAADADGWRQVVGLLNFVTNPGLARGQEIVLRAEVHDDAGAGAVDERVVVAR